MKKIAIGIDDLETTYPKLAQQWNYNKNGELTPKMVSKGSNKKVWWICENGHEYESVIYGRVSGKGCPYCSGRKAIIGENDIISLYPNIAKEWSEQENKREVKGISPYSNKKVWWRCKSGHLYLESPNARCSRNNGCPYCSGHKVLVGYNDLCTTHPIIASEWNYGKNYELSPQMVTKGSHIKVWWKCKEGHEYESTIASRTIGESGCPYCCRRRVVTFVSDLETTHSKLAEEWDYKKNSNLTPRMVSQGSNRKVWWICNKGHSYKSVIISRVRGTGCPYCANQKVLVGYNDLASTCPDILSEWNYSKNGSLTPQMLMRGTKRKVWWTCINGHEYEAIVSDRALNGSGCPYCTNNKVLEGFNDLNSLYPNIAKEWNYVKNGSLSPKMLVGKSGKKVWWKCFKGHDYQSSVEARTNRGTGCPYCTNQKVLAGFNDLETFSPELAKEWNYNKNGSLTPKMITKSTAKKVWWICKKGHDFFCSPNSRTNSNSGCPYCSGHMPVAGINDLKTSHPELMHEWDYEKNKVLTPEKVSEFSDRKVWWKCNLNHSYLCSVANRVQNKNCPFCSGRKVLQGFNDLVTVEPGIAKEWNFEKNGKLIPEMVTKGTSRKVWWLCKNGHEYECTVNSRTCKRTGCPYCVGSKTERLLYLILEKNGITYEAEKKFNAKGKMKEVCHYPFDVFCVDFNIIIEADGIQHFSNDIDFFEEGTPFEERIQHDNIKNEYCLEEGIPILRIPYIFNPDTESEKIEKLVMEFVKERQVPSDILDYYRQYDFSNYDKIAGQLNNL